MFNLRNVVIDANGTLGSKKLLVDVIPVYEYVNDKRTDKILAHRYVTVLPERSFEKIGVRIDGPQLMEKPDGFVEVIFHGLERSASSQRPPASPRLIPSTDAVGEADRAGSR